MIAGVRAISEDPPTPKVAKGGGGGALMAARVGEEEVLFFLCWGRHVMADFLQGEAGCFLRIAATMPVSSQLLANSCVRAAISTPLSLLTPPTSIRSRIASLKGFALSGSGDGAAREGMVVGIDRWCQLSR